jgi:transposase
VLYVALELGGTHWVVASSDGSARSARIMTLRAGDLAALKAELRKARARWRLAAGARTVSCYEAGRDAFWLHRALLEFGVENRVIDSSSIEVNRRHRRAKTDKVDVQKLLSLLWREAQGERKVFSVLHVPTEAEEDQRRPERELKRLQKEATALSNRIAGLLKTQGSSKPPLTRFDIRQVKNWRGQPLAPELQAELQRMHARWQLLREQINELKTRRRRELKSEHKSVAGEKAAKLVSLRGIGERSAWPLATELFAWRQFRNRRQVGGLLGLTATPYRSDGTSREQGISKAGNPQLRSLMVELAWGWLRYQPDSALSRWFEERFSHTKRSRRVGIVAVARKLAIALWRYVEHDQLPEGALLKA